MIETNFRSIHDQPDLSQSLCLGLQPLASDRLVPLSHPHGRVLQETAHTLGGAHEQSRARDLAGDLAHMHRTTFIDANHQPNEVPNLGNSLVWPQFTNSSQPSIIEAVGRHEDPPFLELFPQNYSSGEFRLTNLSFLTNYQTVR